MPRPNRFRCRIVPSAAALLLLAGLAGSAFGKPSEASVDPEAMKAIERMSQFLAARKQFSATIDVGYDIVQDWGQKVEFGETRVVTVGRPNHLRVETTDRDGSQSGVVFDGAQIGVFNMKDKVYATTAQPGSLDRTIAHFVNDLDMHLPLAGVLEEGLPKDIGGWARAVRYVDVATVAGTPCDHIALTGNWEDVQLWIARGDQPLLQRIVITYKRAEGQPQFSAQIKWNLEPSISDSSFTFTPPQGTAKIDFAPQRLGVLQTSDIAGRP